MEALPGPGLPVQRKGGSQGSDSCELPQTAQKDGGSRLRPAKDVATDEPRLLAITVLLRRMYAPKSFTESCKVEEVDPFRT